VALRKDWIAEAHGSGEHGYEVFLSLIEAKVKQMPVMANPQHFQPLGSSAATAS